MPLFDTHIIVDWSAKSKPATRKDSIWWAAVVGGCALEPCNPSTRHAAIRRLATFIAGELDAGRRVLAGFDFPFGYPQGVAQRLTGQASACALWDWLAERIEDKPDNRNNRFEVASEMNGKWPGTGPFWGRPETCDYPQVPIGGRERTRQEEHPPERRIADKRARGAKTVWQLFYSGSVGSQTLVGLPALKRLLEDPRIRSRATVYPFDTGLKAPDTCETPLVLAEIYPSLAMKQVKAHKRDREPLDRAQVRVNAAAFAWLDSQDKLAPLFAGTSDLTVNERRLIEMEEAWILGLGHEDKIRDAAGRIDASS